MDTLKFIQDFRAALNLLKTKGTDQVSVNSLDDHFANMERIFSKPTGKNIKPLLVPNDAPKTDAPAASEADKEQKEVDEVQREFENKMEVVKVQSTQEVAMFNAVMEAGLSALKSAIIINGGAGGALLAFCSAIISKNLCLTTASKAAKVSTIMLMDDLGYAIFVFMIGLGAAGTASATRYLSQYCYARSLNAQFRELKATTWDRAGLFFLAWSIILGVSSFAAFFHGSHKAYIAIATHTAM